ncbi:MAG: glycosyltransferase family 2 protein [Defluviitaleaceae bacterium]|nr:glycosyltransferase family 2 protein [Defluviitaleaceae bacterium]
MFSVVVPVFNEEEVITETYKRLSGVMQGMAEPYELIFVNDGSRDKSAAIIAGFCEADKNVRLINFSRNFGHMSAITAGMEYASGDAIFIIDADLQDPPEIFPQMADKWREGYHVVYGQRKKREGETFFKKASAKIFYRFIKRMTHIEMPVDTGEFRLIDKTVNDAVKKLPEKSRYIRGLVSWVGFKQTAIMYVRNERFAGQTKYPLGKMVAFAMDAVTAFSYKPLKAATTLGFLISIASFIYIAVILFQGLFTDTTVDGWASTMGVILFTQGITMMILGLMGEYIGRIYEELKNRPVYIVQETLGFDENH